MLVAFPSLYRWPALLFGISHLWFLLMLFGVFCLAVFVAVLKPEQLGYAGMCVIVFTTFAVYCAYWYLIGFHHFLCIEQTLYYFAAFLVGYFCAAKKVVKHSGIKTIPVLLVSTALMAAIIWLKPNWPHAIEMFCKTFLSYVICFSCLIIFSRVRLSGRVRTVVLNVEKWSMGIYIFNQIMIDTALTTPVCNEWLRVHWVVGPFVLFAIGFFPPLLLASVFYRYKPLRWAIGG